MTANVTVINGDYSLLYFKSIKGRRLISDNKYCEKIGSLRGEDNGFGNREQTATLKKMYSEDVPVLRKYL